MIRYSRRYTVLSIDSPGSAISGTAPVPWATDQRWVPQWGMTGIDFSQLETPLAIRQPTFEGIDFPFYSRYGTAPTPRRRGKRALALRWAEGSMPLPILDAIIQEGSPPGEVSVDPPRRVWMRRERDRKFHPLHLFTGPALVPLNATSFPDNICRLLEEIQLHLLEVADSGMTWQLWTETEVREAVGNRLRKFFAASGFIRERRTVAGTSGVNTYSLPSDILQVRRVVWNTGVVRVTLSQIDDFALDNSNPEWQGLTGVPETYIEDPLGPNTIQVIPTPSASGTLELVIVPQPEELVGCMNIPIPAMFVPYLKYGVLADMLGKEGEANDPKRAEYCESRWMEGIELAQAFLGMES